MKKGTEHQTVQAPFVHQPAPANQDHHRMPDDYRIVKDSLPLLKKISNVIIVLLIVALLATIIFKLYLLFFIDIPSANFKSIIDNVLLVFIFIELLTILYSYLQRLYIKVERVIELGIISIVREMLFRVSDFEASKIYAVAVLLVALGILFFIEKYWANTRNQ